MRVVALLAALLASPAFADDAYRIDLSLAIDGSPAQAMRVTIPDGGNAIVEFDRDGARHSIEIAAHDASAAEAHSDRVRIDARITAERDGKRSEIGAPSVVARLGQPASVAVGESDTGRGGYRLELTASR